MKKGWKPFSPKNNLFQDSEGNEENENLLPDFNKTKINDTKEPNKQSPQEHLQEQILQVITENFMEMLLDIFNQNIQEEHKKFQNNKNKEYGKTNKQINELIGTLNKHQSETENTINTETNELKTKIANIMRK
jgi:hypothetical protein